jgi:hypothetical protein
MPLPLLLWLGTTSLYLGFCGVFGSLLRSAQSGHPAGRTPPALVGMLLLAPATAFVLGLSAVAIGLRLITLMGGAAAAWFALRQPSWAPVHLWGRRFTRAYFAGAMAITALTELAIALTSASIAAPLLAAAAGIAGAVSLTTSRQA